jgi:hypothetical protein
MATLQATTASNWPAIDGTAVSEVEAIIDEYDFVGNWDNLTIGIDDEDGETLHLVLYGNCTFEATKPVREDGVPVDREHGYTEEFLERLAPHLEEQLVVETIGHEKCRFPVIAVQWIAWPDGTVQSNSFDHSPEQPEASEQDDAQFGVLNTERDILLKLGQFGPTLTSHRDKAAKQAQGEDHLQLVRIETTPVAESEESR